MKIYSKRVERVVLRETEAELRRKIGEAVAEILARGPPKPRFDPRP